MTDPSSDIDSSEQHTDIFAADHISALEVFGKACDDEGLNTAIAIVKDPTTGKPVIFARGHVYDLGVLLNRVTKSIITDLINDLR